MDMYTHVHSTNVCIFYCFYPIDMVFIFYTHVKVNLQIYVMVLTEL